MTTTPGESSAIPVTATDDELRWHLTAYHHRSVGWLARAVRDDMDRVHNAAHTDPGHQHGRADHDH